MVEILPLVLYVYVAVSDPVVVVVVPVDDVVTLVYDTVVPE
jgi:hypothetical protein